AGIPARAVEAVTDFPEILDGRVKTLHPFIHGGLLADMKNPAHAEQLKDHAIQPIDMVVVIYIHSNRHLRKLAYPKRKSWRILISAVRQCCVQLRKISVMLQLS